MPARVTVVAIVLLSTACLPLRSRVMPTSEHDLRYERAVAALERADFAAATPDLRWLVSRCDAGDRGRRALLLYASSELDVRNPNGSATKAAELAAAYLTLPWVAEDEVPLASSLYLLALDVRGAPGFEPEAWATPVQAAVVTEQADAAAAAPEPAPPAGEGGGSIAIAERFAHCDGGGVPEWSMALPEHRGATTAALLASLNSDVTRLDESLASRADSLAAAKTRLSIQQAKIRELEAEIERIRKLLGGGGGGASPIWR